MDAGFGQLAGDAARRASSAILFSVTPTSRRQRWPERPNQPLLSLVGDPGVPRGDHHSAVRTGAELCARKTLNPEWRTALAGWTYLWGLSQPTKRHVPPKPAVDAFLEINGWDLEVLHRDYQVAVRRR